MLNFVPEKVFFQRVLLHYFNMKKSAAESHCIFLVEVYSNHALAERTCQKWFARFKSGDFGLEDEEQEKLEDDYELLNPGESHYWCTLPTTIDQIESKFEGKTAKICDQARIQANFPWWQYSAALLSTGQKLCGERRMASLTPPAF